MELKWKRTGIEMCKQFDNCSEMKRAWKWHEPWYEPCGHYTCVDSQKIYRYSAEAIF